MPRPAGPTREKLLAAAELLFAERGLDGVSAAEITAAAGQRNNSAVQYHFGDKTGLVLAITERHLERISVRRDELLAALDGPVSVRDLARTIVQPLAEGLDDPSAAAYLQIQADLLSRADDLPPLLAAPWDRATMVEVGRHLAALVATDAAEVGHLRRTLITGLIFHSLADRARRYAGHDHGAYVDVLINAVAVLLEAPLAHDEPAD